MSTKSNKRKPSHDYKGSSEHLQKKFDIIRIVDFRLFLFIIAILGIIGILVTRLYQIQVVDALHYHELLAQAQAAPIRLPTVRGEMTDRNGVPLVSNTASNTITYYETKAMKFEEQWALAHKFAEDFDLDPKLNDFDMRELWILLDTKIHEKNTQLLTEEQLLAIKNGEIKSSEVAGLKRDAISDAQLKTITHTEKEAYFVYVKMISHVQGRFSQIKPKATYDEIAYLVEHQEAYPGFSYEVSWNRNYTKEIGINSIIGQISDIPASKIDYYRALGYQTNDKVGTTGLEYQYENLLTGVKPEYEKNQITGELVAVEAGRQGYDLRLSLDLELQKSIEAQAKQALQQAESVYQRRFLNTLQFVVSDPKTGDILAMVGMKRDSDGSYYNDPQSVLLQATPPGSVVKGATIYMGIDEGVITESTVINDTPMYIEATPPRVSWKNLGSINAIQSLQLSSNIYMFHIAIRLGGTSYIPNGPLIYADAPGVYSTMRWQYSQFGLGVKTQIDYPREETGYKGTDKTAGKTLEFAIGQYDNYTALQLNQYVSTIANGGERIAPRLLLDARSKVTKNVVYENQTTILNQVPNKDALDTVRRGFESCALTANCDAINLSSSVHYAGKTGTAQDFFWDDTNKTLNETATSTYVAFAPYENPTFAISCVAPHAYSFSKGEPTLNNICRDLSALILQKHSQRN